MICASMYVKMFVFSCGSILMHVKLFVFSRGSILSATIFVYAACAPLNGFFGGSLYSRQGGT